LSPEFIGSASSLQVVNHLQNVSLVLILLRIFELYLLELFNLSIQVVIDWGKMTVEDFKMIAFKLISNSQDISEISWFVLKQPISMRLVVPSIR
jgi:hypothetical protein